MSSKKIGRNEPCPCGSGKKWKKCHGGAADVAVPTPYIEELLAAFASAGSLRIHDVEPELKALTSSLKSYEPLQVISAVAALSSLVENHTLIFRLDTLLLLAAIHCAGTQVPSRKSLDKWLNVDIPQSQVSRLDDPAEDFAVGVVRTSEGNRLILNGYRSGPDAYLQDVLDTLESGPSKLRDVRSTANAILALSNELVARRKYDRFTGGGRFYEKITIPDSKELWSLVMTQTFTEADLAYLNCVENDLVPFSLTLQQLRTDAREVQIAGSRIESVKFCRSC